MSNRWVYFDSWFNSCSHRKFYSSKRTPCIPLTICVCYLHKEKKIQLNKYLSKNMYIYNCMQTIHYMRMRCGHFFSAYYTLFTLYGCMYVCVVNQTINQQIIFCAVVDLTITAVAHCSLQSIKLL